jgi:hypothetical protein
MSEPTLSLDITSNAFATNNFMCPRYKRLLIYVGTFLGTW